MYANAPHASATTPPSSPTLQPQAQAHALQAQVQHGQQPAYGVPQAAPAPASAPTYASTPTGIARPVQATATTFVTGAYQPSGDPAIDRMIRLEAACKRFGSPF